MQQFKLAKEKKPILEEHSLADVYWEAIQKHRSLVLSKNRIEKKKFKVSSEGL